jgi:hypothetical protein
MKKAPRRIRQTGVVFIRHLGEIIFPSHRVDFGIRPAGKTLRLPFVQVTTPAFPGISLVFHLKIEYS